MNNSFQEFQKFRESSRLRALAALPINHEAATEILSRYMMLGRASNDNDHQEDREVFTMLLSQEFMRMLQCWDECGRDMLLTKLTWNSHWFQASKVDSPVG